MERVVKGKRANRRLKSHEGYDLILYQSVVVQGTLSTLVL